MGFSLGNTTTEYEKNVSSGFGLVSKMVLLISTLAILLEPVDPVISPDLN